MSIYPEEIITKMEKIVNDNPSTLCFEDDARYTWPNRWKELVIWVSEHQGHNSY